MVVWLYPLSITNRISAGDAPAAGMGPVPSEGEGALKID